MMNEITVKSLIQAIPDCWRHLIGEELDQPYWHSLVYSLNQAVARGAIIYPERSLWFAALSKTPPNKVRVVILGQDPYHGPSQAHGLSFSVQKGIAIPPSLSNIYKEIYRDLKLPIPDQGNLSYWAAQGVLLLNTVLTVEQNRAGSHRFWGWEKFTDRLIEKLASHYQHIVFMLWGKFAQEKIHLIPKSQHCILCSPHPSPLSAHRGFIGNQHFSRANRYLIGHGEAPIDWQVQ